MCAANQSNDIFAYANENSQFDRTDNNQFAKSAAAQKSQKNHLLNIVSSHILLINVIRRRMFFHTSKEEKVGGICFQAIALEILWEKYLNLGGEICNKSAFVLRKCEDFNKN